MSIVFVRHSQPDIDPATPRRRWLLSPEGRRRAERLGETLTAVVGRREVSLVASDEIKAIETAELLGLGAVNVDERFGEVAKHWYAEPAAHEEAVRQFLGGTDQVGWESRRSALDRFDAAVNHLTGRASLDGRVSIVVTHGTVLSLWLDERVDGLDAASFWLDLKMPDAWQLDAATSSISRLTRE